MNRAELSENIKREAVRLGYTRCGIIPAEPFEEYKRYLDKRVETYPDSEPLYKKLYNLALPSDEGKSIIVCVRAYNKYKAPEKLYGLIGKYYLFDGRLSFTDEYKNKSIFVDYLKENGVNIIRDNVTARWAAEKSGLGFFARNNFIYTDCGSYISIDTWTVDTELEYDEPIPVDAKERRTCSSGCRKCVDACPTGALSDSFSMDMGKCIAQLSFHTKEPLPEETMERMGTWMYGCDICQDVCPMNRGKLKEAEDFPELNGIEAYMSPEDILNMSEEDYLNVVQPRFWYIGRDDMWIWKCNALRSMVNSGKTQYYDIIKSYSNDPDERIRNVALWGCKKLMI